MELPSYLNENVRNLALVAEHGHAVSGRGVLVIAYRGDEVRELHYIPVDYMDAFRESMPMLEVAEEKLAAYDPSTQFVLLAIDLEHPGPGCYVMDLAD